MSDLTANEAFAPGEYLRDELVARGWTQTEFAEIIGRPLRVVNEIIAAKRGITPDTAKELAAALGTTAQLWLNLESAYQLATARPASAAISRKAQLRQKFPVREMMKRGWIPELSDFETLQKSVLGFFDLKSIDDPIVFPHAARRNYHRDLSNLQLAWLFRVKKLADALHTPVYSKLALSNALSRLERLTTDPEEARHIARILTECGVKFVVVEPLAGSNIDGVCFWTNNDRSPVIGMTIRFDRNDNFWFVLRHEIEHVLREDAKLGMILDEDVASTGGEIDEQERLANEAAQEFCVPNVEMTKFIGRVRPYFTEQKVMAFAKRIDRHPGLVVGQLQHRLTRPDLLNKVKAKIRVHVVGSALTDGWGVVAPN